MPGFQLEYAGSTGPDPAALGPWQTTAPPTPEAATTSFSSVFGGQRSTPVSPVPEWRALLPADRRLAALQLANAEGAVETTRLALPVAFRRLQGIARIPEQLASLAPAWEQAVQGCSAFLERVKMALASLASVRTRVGAVFSAWTVVRWPAGLTTVQRAGLSPEDADLHRRAVRLALSTRATILHTLVLVVRGAGVLATAVSSPVGPLLALPAAWRLIDDVQGRGAA